MVLRTTDMLSPSIHEDSSRVNPSILILWHHSTSKSVAIPAATSSEPWVEVSTVFCYLDIQVMGVLFIRRTMPVTDFQVT